MNSAHADLVALLVLLIGSFGVAMLADRLRLPSAVTLIGYGVLVGPRVLGLMPEARVVDFLYEVGFLVLMFLAGMEIDFNGIRGRGRRAMLLVFGICMAIFSLSFLAVHLFHFHPLYGLAVGAMSVGLPLSVMRETRLVKTPLGQLILIVASVGEFLTVIGMTVFYFAIKYGFSWELALGLGKLLLVMAFSALVLRLFMALAWWHPKAFARMVQSGDGSELGVRFTLLLMMVFSIVAVLAGLESIIGAFVAGAVVAFVLRGKEVLEEKLAAVGHGLFVPIFFIIVGLRFDLALVSPGSMLSAALLLMISWVVRLVPCSGLIFLGMSMKNAVAAASLLSAPLTLVIAISVIGEELHVVGPYAKGTFIALAVSAGLLFPTMFRLLSRAPSRLDTPGAEPLAARTLSP